MYSPSISSPLNDGWQDSFVSVSIQVQRFPFSRLIGLILFSEHVGSWICSWKSRLNLWREGPPSKFLLLYLCPQAWLETSFTVFWFISKLSSIKVSGYVCFLIFSLFFFSPQNLYSMCSFAICCLSLVTSPGNRSLLFFNLSLSIFFFKLLAALQSIGTLFPGSGIESVLPASEEVLTPDCQGSSSSSVFKNNSIVCMSCAWTLRQFPKLYNYNKCKKLLCAFLFSYCGWVNS